MSSSFESKGNPGNAETEAVTEDWRDIGDWREEDGYVKIHWCKNGFHADVKDILSHPNAKRQFRKAMLWFREYKKNRQRSAE